MRSIKREGIQAYKSNTFRVFEDDDKSIRIEFGTKQKENGEEFVKINSSTQISPKMIVRLAERLVLVAALYQEKYDVNLGLEGSFEIEFEEGE